MYPPPTAPQQNQIFHYKKYLYLIKRSELDSLSAVMPMQRTVFSQRVYVSSGIKLLCAPEKIFLFKFFSWCWCSVCCFPTQGGMPPCQAVCCFPTQGLNYCGALHHFRCDDTYARWEIGRLWSNPENRPYYQLQKLSLLCEVSMAKKQKTRGGGLFFFSGWKKHWASEWSICGWNKHRSCFSSRSENHQKNIEIGLFWQLQQCSGVCTCVRNILIYLIIFKSL